MRPMIGFWRFATFPIFICCFYPRHVAGLNVGRARNIAEWREKNGPFINREQLKLVKGMGPKTYQQCAGFIRINPQTRCTLTCQLDCVYSDAQLWFHFVKRNGPLPQKAAVCMWVTDRQTDRDRSCELKRRQQILQKVRGKARPLPHLRHRKGPNPQPTEL